MKAVLYGAQAEDLRDEVAKTNAITLDEAEPEVVICYGGDGTLLSAEQEWPGIPKVPIRNSSRGHRCIPHPPAAVFERLAKGELVRTEFLKLGCSVYREGEKQALNSLLAMNEFNVHMGHINSAVRFRVWIDDEPWGPTVHESADHEIVGDGFVVSTPFGSTAYFNQITRGVFHTGMGLAFKFTSEQANHVVAPESSVFRILITRGPAVLAFDNASTYVDLEEGDELVMERHDVPAVLLTFERMKYPSDRF